MVHEEDKQDLRIPAKRGGGVSQRGKKDRHDGRPIIYNNVEKQIAGTEAEDVGVVSRSSETDVLH